MPSPTQCPAVRTTWGAISEAPHTYTFTSSESASVPPMLPTSTCRAGHVSHYGARVTGDVHLHDDRAHVRPLSEPRLANIGLLCGELYTMELYSKAIIDELLTHVEFRVVHPVHIPLAALHGAPLAPVKNAVVVQEDGLKTYDLIEGRFTRTITLYYIVNVGLFSVSADNAGLPAPGLAAKVLRGSVLPLVLVLGQRRLGVAAAHVQLLGALRRRGEAVLLA